MGPIGCPETSAINYHLLQKYFLLLLTLEMGPLGCPETSVMNYHYSPRNNPQERSSHMNTICGQNSQLRFIKTCGILYRLTAEILKHTPKQECRQRGASSCTCNTSAFRRLVIDKTK